MHPVARSSSLPALLYKSPSGSNRLPGHLTAQPVNWARLGLLQPIASMSPALAFMSPALPPCLQLWSPCLQLWPEQPFESFDYQGAPEWCSPLPCNWPQIQMDVFRMEVWLSSVVSNITVSKCSQAQRRQTMLNTRVNIWWNFKQVLGLDKWYYDLVSFKILYLWETICWNIHIQIMRLSIASS